MDTLDRAPTPDHRQTAVPSPPNHRAVSDADNRKQFRHDVWLPPDLHAALQRFAVDQGEAEAIAHRILLRGALRSFGYLEVPNAAR
jgi:hypothetical protein